MQHVGALEGDDQAFRNRNYVGHNNTRTMNSRRAGDVEGLNPLFDQPAADCNRVRNALEVDHQVRLSVLLGQTER